MTGEITRCVIGLEIDDGSVLSADEDNRLKWVVYGSSITMGRQAVNGASTWPGIAARKMDLNLTNLGFGGECHVDPLISDVIIRQNPRFSYSETGD